MDQKSTQQILKILYKILAEGLPSSGGGGADATAANQTTQITKLTSIDTETTAQGLTLDAIQTAVEIIDNAVSGNEMQVDIVSSGDMAVPTGLGHGTVNVTGTAAAIAGATACKYVVIRAKDANTGVVSVGGTGVTTGSGYFLNAGDSITLWIDDLAEVFVVSTVSGDDVDYTYAS
jgi:hypothetical protein